MILSLRFYLSFRSFVIKTPCYLDTSIRRGDTPGCYGIIYGKLRGVTQCMPPMKMEMTLNKSINLHRVIGLKSILSGVKVQTIYQE
jgi:hypothetical protein